MMSDCKKDLRDLEIARGLREARNWQRRYGGYQELGGIFVIGAIDRIVAKRREDSAKQPAT